MTTPAEVIAGRRRWQADLVAQARRFVEGLDPGLDVRAAAVVGSVARGDFSTASDIDVLVVAASLPARARDRLAAADWPRADAPDVEAIIWTPDEHRRQCKRGNPIAVEADKVGIWLVGGPAR